MVRGVTVGLLVSALIASIGAPSVAAQEAGEPGTPGGPGLAIRARKALTAAFEGEQVVDNAVLLVKDGLIEALGPVRTTPVPEGYQVRDVGGQVARVGRGEALHPRGQTYGMALRGVVHAQVVSDLAHNDVA